MSSFVLCQQATQGQSILRGRLRDTALNKDCSSAVVVLLQADSTLITFTRSHKDGSFSFKDIALGGYRLLVTHPAYSEYRMPVIISNDTITDLGTLLLQRKTDMLAAVIVTAKNPPPRMRGDTLEYSTTGIKTRINASVEELLSRLPGVHVDQHGVITVNGKRIERLLVDGEDIFGGDPTVVTRNFNADMIAKVQVLDKKSAQAEFTGIDDGSRTKTLNLTLKNDSKRGYFINGQVGGAPQGYYNVNGILGAFKGRRQFTALGTMSNTGSLGFGDGSGNLGSGMNFNSGVDDALGASAGAGIPRIMGGGVHYANSWNGNADHFNGQYSYGRLTTNPYSSSTVSQILPDSIYGQQQRSNSVNTSDQHLVIAEYDFNADTLSSFRLIISGNNSQGQNQLTSSGISSFNDTLVNSSLRNIHSDVQNQAYNGTIMWRISSLKKKQRNFSVIAGMAKQENSSKGFLYSLNNFYQPNSTLLRTDTIDQRKEVITNGLFFNSSLNYTEPMWKNVVLGLSYGMSFNKSQSLLSTYNKGDGKYEDYIDSLSNHYQNNILRQQGTINLQVQDKAFSFTLGGDIDYVIYRQIDILKNSVLHYHYFDIAPRVNAIYNINNYKGFNFTYTSNTQQPSVMDLQPIQNNNDPLHVTLGNPYLRPSFSHNFSLSYHNLLPIVLNIEGHIGFTTSAISTKTYTDSLGKQISQAVNVGGSQTVGVYFSLYKKIKSIDLDLGLNTNMDYIRSVNYINQYLSLNDNYIAGGGISVNKFVGDKYSIQLNTNSFYNYSQSSINISAHTHFWTQVHTAQFSVFLLPGFELGTSALYNWRQKLDAFDIKNSTLLWNAYISKNLFNNQLAIRWQINDILHQNAGISRSISANQTSQTITNIIGRYWMLSASWRFVHRRKVD